MGFKARKIVGIEVTKDPDGGAVERCFRCFRRTAFWYGPKDVACCPGCATLVTDKAVPSKEMWCAMMDFYEPVRGGR